MNEGNSPENPDRPIVPRPFKGPVYLNDSRSVILTPQRKLEVSRFTKSTEEGNRSRKELASQLRSDRQKYQAGQLAQKEFEALQEKKRTLEEGRASRVYELEQERGYLKLKIKAWEGSIAKRAFALALKLFKADPAAALGKNENNWKQLVLSAEGFSREISLLNAELERLSRCKDAQRNDLSTLSKFYVDNETVLRMKEWNDNEVDKQRKLEDHIKERGTVKVVAEKHDTYIVHGVNPWIMGGQNNGLLKDGVTWDKKMMVAVACSPSMSASFLPKGCRDVTLWSPIGLVYAQGLVQEVNSGDAATMAYDLKTRKSAFSKTYSEDVAAAYDQNMQGTVQALRSGKNIRGANELIMSSDSEFAGVFIDLSSRWHRDGMVISGLDYSQNIHTINADKDGEMRNKQVVHDFRSGVAYKDIFETAKLAGLPVFGFKDGVAHQIVYEPHSRQILIGEEISPVDMTKAKNEIPSENKQQVHRIAADSLTIGALV